MIIYGYCRISTPKQNIERQERNIIALYPNAKIYKETYTGKLVDRPVFQKLLSIVKPKDTVVFDSVSRMSRNATEGFELYKHLYNKDVNLIFLKERYIDTNTYKQAANKQIDIQTSSGDKATDELIKNISEAINKYVLSLAEKQIYLAFEQSQKEVDDLRVRTKEGIETARRNGKQIGRVKGNKYTSKKEPIVKEAILKYSKAFGGNNTDAQVMKLAGVHSEAYYKYKKELLNDYNNISVKIMNE